MVSSTVTLQLMLTSVLTRYAVVVTAAPADMAAAAVAAPNAASMVAAATATAAAAPVAVAHVPAHVGTAISKTVHYAETPIVTGYTSTLYKPDLSLYDAPFRFDPQLRYLRPIKTLVPKLVPVEMPAAVKAVEIHPPILPEVRIANVVPPYYSSAFASLIP